VDEGKRPMDSSLDERSHVPLGCSQVGKPTQWRQGPAIGFLENKRMFPKTGVDPVSATGRIHSIETGSGCGAPTPRWLVTTHATPADFPKSAIP
jgi:hypothetical protein